MFVFPKVHPVVFCRLVAVSPLSPCRAHPLGLTDLPWGNSCRLYVFVFPGSRRTGGKLGGGVRRRREGRKRENGR